MKTKILISILSFGDFIIDFSHFKSAKKDIDKIFVGEHLRPIVEALGVQDEVTFIDVGLDTPPKLFNYRKSSLLSVLKSFFLIRKTLKSSYSNSFTYIVPHWNLRWRMLLGFKDYDYVRKNKENIYLRYAQKFRCAESNVLSNKQCNSDMVYIFPESRQVEKSLKKRDLDTITRFLGSLEVKYKIVLVGGPDMCSDVPEIHYVSNLTELIKCVKASRYCISVDSLPVHLAVFYNKPVFVFAPFRNDRLFPESVLNQNGWDYFGSITNFTVWIDGL